MKRLLKEKLENFSIGHKELNHGILAEDKKGDLKKARLALSAC